MLTHDDVIRRPERLSDDGAADLGLAGANRWHGSILRVEGYVWVGLAPPETHRSIAGVEHRGSPKQEAHNGGDLWRNREGRKHGEVVQLTLVACKYSSVKGKSRCGGDLARRPSVVRKKTRKVSMIPRLPARFRRRGGGRDHGGAPGAFSWS